MWNRPSRISTPWRPRVWISAPRPSNSAAFRPAASCGGAAGEDSMRQIKTNFKKRYTCVHIRYAWSRSSPVARFYLLRPPNQANAERETRPATISVYSLTSSTTPLLGLLFSIFITSLATDMASSGELERPKTNTHAPASASERASTCTRRRLAGTHESASNSKSSTVRGYLPRKRSRSIVFRRVQKKHATARAAKLVINFECERSNDPIRYLPQHV